MRYLQVLAPRQPLRVAPPLRILGMVARPGDLHALDGGYQHVAKRRPVDDSVMRARRKLRLVKKDSL